MRNTLTSYSTLTAAMARCERVRGLVLRVAAVLCALFALSAGMARAEAPKLVPNGTFASEGGLGIAVDNSCSLHVPPLTGSACTAFDPSADDVFVTGFINFLAPVSARSEKFDASGELLSPPSPFAEGANFGAVVNPTNGDLYVASEAANEIDTYDPNTGALLSSFPVPPFGNPLENLAQIATDSAGNVYVPNVPNNEVLEYSLHPACGGEPVECVPLKTFTGSEKHTLSKPTGVAVDSSGNVWVADDGNNRIEEFKPTGEFKSEFKSEGVRSIALDGHGDVLAIVDSSADPCGVLPPPCGHLVEYSSSGVQLADLGAGEFGSTSYARPLSMVAVDEGSGRAYVTDGAKNLVWVFQPPVAPVIGKESAVEVGTSEAKLGALVNPGGAAATYRFEYDTRGYTEGEAPHGVSVPFPEGSTGPGFSSRAVWASAKSLAPGTTYHYRVVVTNGVGNPIVGPDETFTTESAAQAACPNEQFRGGFSAALPDCRAYEAVVPPNKASAQPLTNTNAGEVTQKAQAANDGNRVAWESAEVLPGSRSAGLEDLATRGASGWSSEDAIPLQDYNGDRCVWASENGVVAYSPDLSKAIVRVNAPTADGGDKCQEGEITEVVPGEPPGVINLLLHNNETGAYQLINVTSPDVTPANANFDAASENFSRVLFEESAKLTPEAPVTGGEYEWSEGVVHLLKFALPSGAPVAGSFVSFSPDGSEMFFTADGNLYVRLNDERTIQVDEARGGRGPGGGGSFAALTADGSQVFFTADASAGLTKDTVPGSGTNLYSFDTDTGQLSDLTPVSDAKAALTGIGEDGSYVYFTAEAVMSGSQANQFGETAESGQQNLYLSHHGTITFVKHGGGQVSPNGAYLAFGSYLYSAAANRSQCWSCNPFGVPGGVENSSDPSNNGQVFFQTSEALLPRDTNGQKDVYEYDYASGLHLISTGTSSSESRLLGSSASGNDVFFLGRQALLPGESNQESHVIYDARVDGGFPESAVPPDCGTADACRTAPEPQPVFPAAGVGTAAVFGEDNLSAPPPPLVKKVTKKTVKCKNHVIRKRVKKKEECVRKPKKAKKANRRAK